MGLIIEPEGVDFTINSKPLTEKEQSDLSAYIIKRKQEIRLHRKTTPIVSEPIQSLVSNVKHDNNA